MSVLLLLMKKRVLLFSVVGNRVIGGHFRYLPLFFNVVVSMKERVLFILFRAFFRFDELVRKLGVVVMQRFVVGVIQNAIRPRAGRAQAPVVLVPGDLERAAAAAAGAVGFEGSLTALLAEAGRLEARARAPAGVAGEGRVEPVQRPLRAGVERAGRGWRTRVPVRVGLGVGFGAGRGRRRRGRRRARALPRERRRRRRLLHDQLHLRTAGC